MIYKKTNFAMSTLFAKLKGSKNEEIEREREKKKRTRWSNRPEIH